MAEQYWIGGFFIDLSRNQIRQNGQSQTLAPKALAVLTYLAEHQGKVVSQEALLDKVWQGTVVSPNTLQRSIAQLRKALGDDGKVQVYIKTHAKKGYSLECDVRWQEHLQKIEASEDKGQFEATAVAPDSPPQQATQNTLNAATIEKTSRSDTSKKLNWAMLSVFGAVFLALIAYWLVAPSKPEALNFGEFRALTATDKKEFSGIYSPDGRFAVFSRYENLLCQNKVWAKDLATQKEYQLTQNIGAYSGHTFSKDGNTLVLIKEQDCQTPVTQQKCYKLMSLDFAQGLNSPQSLSELMECKNSAIRRPIWLNNNNIALLQNSDKRWKLISYSIEKNNSQVLFETPEGNIVDYDYSPKDDVFALITISSDEHYYINMINADGKLLSSNQVQLPKEIAKHRNFRPNFSPIDGQLIFSTGRQLFTLSDTGEVTNISLLLDEPMSSPIFHPNGERMIVVKGHYDADVIAMPLTEFSQSDDFKVANFSVLARSTAGEYNAMLQPNGELTAFKSKRSGEEQVWLLSEEGSRQLTRFPMDSYIIGMAWAADGKSLLVNANHQLTQVFLDGTIEPVALAHSVMRLFHWDSNTHSALASVRVNGVSILAELNLHNGTIQPINDKPIGWAQETADGRLIYTDSLARFWLQGAVEDQLITALEGQGDNKGFLVRNGVIYGVNKALQLWSYSLDDENFEIITKVPANLDHITDIDDTTLYGVIRVSAKKELAELFLKSR